MGDKILVRQNYLFFVKFKMPVRNPRVRIKQADEYMSMEFRKKVSATDINLGRHMNNI